MRSGSGATKTQVRNAGAPDSPWRSRQRPELAPARTWQQVADEYERRTGERMSRSNAQRIAARAEARLRAELEILLDELEGGQAA